MDDGSESPFLRSRSVLFRASANGDQDRPPEPASRFSTSLLGSDVAIRLYQSVRRTDISPSHVELNNAETTSTAESNAPQCRICRYMSQTNQLIPCPCKCTGSVGFIHLKCLNRWIRVRRTKLCEICKQEYNTPALERKYFALFLAFFRPKYLGVILKDIFNIMSVTPLVYFTVYQLVETMEATSEKPSIKLMVFGPTLLLATSVYFFLYFDWALSCMMRMKSVLNHWWSFGDQDDDELDDFLPDFNFRENDFFDLDF
ncbi:unnamed protein product [Hermetia illucens]|uniref:RING-CH-type domain-containing protein n=1 Tax=Hermetia illucens TaxID=343691 RepID=A0A7R8V3V0_HERIL|nr:E3 ubiquitin-protein ligase MARCHF3 [Hermetia illucens]CAD7091695.1 unnamed protein product [Hermetia illucens]